MTEYGKLTWCVCVSLAVCVSVGEGVFELF